jgi:hypothetical protein
LALPLLPPFLWRCSVSFDFFFTHAKALIFFSLCFQCLQFIVRQIINEAKTSNGYIAIGDSRAKRRIHIARVLTSNYAFVTSLIFILLEQTGIVTALDYHYVNFPQLTSTIDYFGYATGIVHPALFIIIIAIVVLIDVIVDVKKNGWWTGYISARDPLNFRVDFIWISLVVVFVVIYSIIYLLSNGNLALNIIAAIVELGFRLSLIMAGGLSCILVIFKRFLLRRTAEQQPENPMEQLLKLLESTSKKKQMFLNYCNSEFSSENIFAYQDIVLYKEIRDRNERIQACKDMYEKYLRSRAVNEVNVPQKVRANLTKAIDSINDETSDSDLPNIFQEFDREVKINLLDTFSRFKLSNQYRKARSSYVELTPRANTPVVYGTPDETPSSPIALDPNSFNIEKDTNNTPVTPSELKNEQV